jgi:hypothetical protein
MLRKQHALGLREKARIAVVVMVLEDSRPLFTTPLMAKGVVGSGTLLSFTLFPVA